MNEQPEFGVAEPLPGGFVLRRRDIGAGSVCAKVATTASAATNRKDNFFVDLIYIIFPTFKLTV
jgi:hypothetical protein